MNIVSVTTEGDCLFAEGVVGGDWIMQLEFFGLSK
jgi:hypothetical protein